MKDALDPVWKALADPSRRRLLDLLRDGPRTTGQLCAEFGVTRFAVMKHLRVLVDADLVIVTREGRERWNHLNAAPLRQIYERWIGEYQDVWATRTSRLKRRVESRHKKGETQ